jgi:CBS domain-containing protein
MRKIIPDVIGKQQLLELPESSSVRDAAVRMRDRQVGAVLITRDGRLEGIFTERDVLNRVVAAGRHPDHTSLADVMTRNPDSVAPDDTALDALRRMCERGYRHLPLVDEGRLVGIVSRRDFFGEEIAEVEGQVGHAQTF